MPVKKMKKPKKARAPRGSAAEKKKGLKQKQKQKQVVTVQVSSGGSGGGGYIPIPQAPEINYALLANLIKPAATVDVPIAAKNPEISAARTKILEKLAMRPMMGSSAEGRFGYEPMRESFSASSAKVGGGSSKMSFEPSESESIAPKASEVKPKRKYTRKPIAVAVEAEREFMPARGGEFERMIVAQKELGQRPSSQQSLPTYFDVPESGTESESNVRSAFQRLKEKQKQEIAGASSFV